MNGERQSSTTTWRAFTLVELLVVVAIISMLMSSMLPSLTRAQKQGEQAVCQANLHQLMLAWHQFALENDDKLCAPSGHSRHLHPFLQDGGAFVCPTDLNGHAKSEVTQSLQSSYAVSATMGGGGRDGMESYRRWHHIRQPGGRLVFVDVSDRGVSVFWPVLREEEQWFWRPVSFPIRNTPHGLSARHRGGVNRSFADGHVERYRYRDVRTLQWIKGVIADPNAASAENSDLADSVAVLKRL